MLRAIDKWLCGYMLSMMRRPKLPDSERHVLFCVADHFEPFRRDIAPDGTVTGGRPQAEAAGIVRRWCEDYRESVSGITDSDGVPPRHTFFFPEDEYDTECVDILGDLCADGLGEVEIQVHHRNDTAEGLRQKLVRYRDTLHQRHGALGRDREGRPRYGFVHGNWCLCNSRPDGDWCGVNEELGILAESGCYADFTFPSAPSPTQPRTVNTIYRARDIPGRPRSHDRGEAVTVRNKDHTHIPTGSYTRTPLLLIPGPLALDWRRRKFGCLPRLETGAITGANPPTSTRVDLWVRQHIHVDGRPEWIFVKIHSHGCVADSRKMMLGPQMKQMHGYLAEAGRTGDKWRLHYVSAREMYNVIRAAEDEEAGNPADFRDYEVSRPDWRR